MRHLVPVLVLGLVIVSRARAEFDDGLIAFDEGDHATAPVIWQPLAEAGDADAQNALGDMYLYGRGVPRDPTVAIDWYERAAAQGHAGAQNHLGVIHVNGYGVAVDRVTAFMWWKLAAERGINDASHAPSVLGDRMTPSEINEANARAVAWSQGNEP